ncbi:hypothetical protein DICPUDRAFT_157772, partial [Dictyostelium purpureum]
MKNEGIIKSSQVFIFFILILMLTSNNSVIRATSSNELLQQQQHNKQNKKQQQQQQYTDDSIIFIQNNINEQNIKKQIGFHYTFTQESNMPTLFGNTFILSEGSSLIGGGTVDQQLQQLQQLAQLHQQQHHSNILQRSFIKENGVDQLSSPLIATNTNKKKNNNNNNNNNDNSVNLVGLKTISTLSLDFVSSFKKSYYQYQHVV